MRLPFGVWRRGIGEGYRGTCLLAAIVTAAGMLALFPAAALSYPCITRGPSSSHAQSDERCRPQRRAAKRERHSSFLELAFAGGIFVVLLLVPVVPKNLDLWEDRRSGRDSY
jgi:hypothetical protein